MYIVSFCLEIDVLIVIRNYQKIHKDEVTFIRSCFCSQKIFFQNCYIFIHLVSLDFNLNNSLRIVLLFFCVFLNEVHSLSTHYTTLNMYAL